MKPRPSLAFHHPLTCLAVTYSLWSATPWCRSTHEQGTADLFFRRSTHLLCRVLAEASLEGQWQGFQRWTSHHGTHTRRSAFPIHFLPQQCGRRAPILGSCNPALRRRAELTQIRFCLQEAGVEQPPRESRVGRQRAPSGSAASLFQSLLTLKWGCPCNDYWWIP